MVPSARIGSSAGPAPRTGSTGNSAGGKHHVVLCHHELGEYLLAYIDAAGMRDELASPLFCEFEPRNRMLGRRPLRAVKTDDVVLINLRAAQKA